MLKGKKTKTYSPGENINTIVQVEIPIWLEAKLLVWAGKRKLKVDEAVYRIVKNYINARVKI